MKIRDCIRLSKHLGFQAEMEVFLSCLLSCSRLDLLARDDEEIPVAHLQALQLGWSKIQQGYPVAYLTGSKEFYGLNFFVEPGVLIPRDTSEQMIELVRDLEIQKAFDLGTGTGALGLSLKSARPELELSLVDISKQALALAQKNAEALALEVKVVESDLLEALPVQNCDLIVANLPYIGTKTHHFIAENVLQHEPALALFGGDDGFELYRRLLEDLHARAWPLRYLLIEMAFSQAPLLQELAEVWREQWDVYLFQDYEGLDRFGFFVAKGHKEFALEKTLAKGKKL